MKQTLISTHFPLKPLVQGKRKASQDPLSSPRPLEKKIKITEKDSEIVVTFSHSPAKAAPINDWRLYAKNEECPLGAIFQNHPPSNSMNERSTTQATFSSMNAQSFGFENRPFRKLNFEEEPIENNGFSREATDILARLKEKRPEVIRPEPQSQGVSREAMDVIKQIRAKASIKDQNKGFVPCQTGDLPSEFRRLLIKFETFENTLFFHVFRRIPTFFQNLARDSKVSLKEFLQILCIFPNEYEVSWQKNPDAQNELDLRVNFPVDALKEKTSFVKSIEYRKEVFKARLVSFYKQQESIAPNSDFTVPEGSLPAKPSQKPVESLKDFLQRSEVKNKELMAIMKETAGRIAVENPIETEKTNDKNEVSLRKNGLSEKLLMKIKEKEKLVNQTKARLESEKKGCKVEEMVAIVDVIKYHFSVRGVSNMFLVNLVRFIHDHNTTFIISEIDIVGLIEKLAEICPDWLKIIPNEAGKLVRINKDVPVFNVLKQIRAL